VAQSKETNVVHFGQARLSHVLGAENLKSLSGLPEKKARR